MKSGSKGNASEVEEASAAGQPGNGKPPHWRRREHATTTVYVVHPTQFRTVVQQLTGTGTASPPPPLSTHLHVGGGGGNGGNGAGACTRTNRVPQAQDGGGEQSGGSSRGRTLGQMYQDCLDWANADDD